MGVVKGREKGALHAANLAPSPKPRNMKLAQIGIRSRANANGTGRPVVTDHQGPRPPYSNPSRSSRQPAMLRLLGGAASLQTRRYISYAGSVLV